jgi:hypothetical protein
MTSRKYKFIADLRILIKEKELSEIELFGMSSFLNTPSK